MTIHEAFSDNPKLQDFLEFLEALGEDSDFDNKTEPHIYGILVLFLATQNISIILSGNKAVSLFSDPTKQSKLDMDSFIYERLSEDVVIIMEQPIENYLEVALDAVNTLKHIT